MKEARQKVRRQFHFYQWFSTGGNYVPPNAQGDIRPCLETFFLVTWQREGSATGILKAEDAKTLCKTQARPPQQGITQPQMSMVPRLRNPDLYEILK